MSQLATPDEGPTADPLPDAEAAEPRAAEPAAGDPPADDLADDGHAQDRGDDTGGEWTLVIRHRPKGKKKAKPKRSCCVANRKELLPLCRQLVERGEGWRRVLVKFPYTGGMIRDRRRLGTGDHAPTAKVIGSDDRSVHCYFAAGDVLLYLEGRLVGDLILPPKGSPPFRVREPDTGPPVKMIPIAPPPMLPPQPPPPAGGEDRSATKEASGLLRKDVPRRS